MQKDAAKKIRRHTVAAVLFHGVSPFEFAVICEGIHYRHVNGLTVGDGFDKIGAMVPDLVQRGLAALGR